MKTSAKTPMDFVEGASMMVLMALRIREACDKQPEKKTATVPKRDLVAVARMLRVSSVIIDNLVLAVERGESFEEMLSRLPPKEPKEPQAAV